METLAYIYVAIAYETATTSPTTSEYPKENILPCNTQQNAPDVKTVQKSHIRPNFFKAI